MRAHKQAIKPLAHAVVVFVALGITIANETMSQLGLEQNYFLLFSVALILAALMLTRNKLLIAVVALGVILLNLPQETLSLYSIDQDVLLAFVCATILVPSLYDLITR